MTHQLLAAITLAACCGCSDGIGREASDTPAPPGPSRHTTTAPGASPAIVPPTVAPESGTRVLHPELVWTGSHRFPRLAVPRRYQISFACAGRRLLLLVDGAREGDYPCTGPGPTHVILTRPAGTAAVSINVVTDPDTAWALLVSTAGSIPR